MNFLERAGGVGRRKGEGSAEGNGKGASEGERGNIGVWSEYARGIRPDKTEVFGLMSHCRLRKCAGKMCVAFYGRFFFQQRRRTWYGETHTYTFSNLMDNSGLFY